MQDCQVEVCVCVCVLSDDGREWNMNQLLFGPVSLLPSLSNASMTKLYLGR